MTKVVMFKDEMYGTWIYERGHPYYELLVGNGTEVAVELDDKLLEEYIEARDVYYEVLARCLAATADEVNTQETTR
mgnify:CR=1 FL=1